MTTAYLYIRWSSARQEAGDSLRRQRTRAQKYAAQHNLTIEELPIDDGISAFTGKNLTEGSLGKFIDDVENGLIQTPTVLLVEAVDRLSRVDVWSGSDILRKLVSLDVSVITLQDGKVRDKTNINSLETAIMDVLSSELAAQESRKKSDRLQLVWSAKKKRAMEHGEAITNMVPFWLSRDGIKFKLNQQYIPTIEKMFELYINGMGTNAIANYLNENKIPTPMTARKVQAAVWYGESIRKLLLNKALIGHYKDKVDYYPIAIDPVLFAKAQQTKGVVKEKRGGGNNNDNILARLCRCAKCGDSMYRRISHNKKEYRCRTGINDKTKCNAKRWNADDVNNIVLSAVKEINIEELLSNNTSTLIKSLQDQINVLSFEHDENTKKRSRILTAIESSDDDISELTDRLKVLKQETKNIEAQLAAVKKQLDDANSYATVFATAQSNVAALYNNDTPENRLKINLEFRKIIDKITLDNERKVLKIYYKNNMVRKYATKNALIKFERDADGKLQYAGWDKIN